ncbi:hypothetical protein [Cetobacterium sp.]|uniref:hypothetical protein n=1 Tax=Cetobacterium sp. TaxID=2071632 RepID=UPI003F2CAFA3
MDWIIEFVKTNILITLIIFYAFFSWILSTLNLNKNIRYKQIDNLIFLSIIIVFNFIGVFYISKIIDYKKFTYSIFYWSYFIPGIITVVMLVLDKIVIKISCKESEMKKELRESSPYEKVENSYYLKDHYRFVRDTVKVLVVIFALFSIISNYVIINKFNMYELHSEIPVTPYFPLFSTIGYLFMFELFNYLNGNQNKVSEKLKKSKKNEVSKEPEEINSFKELYSHYKNVWPANIMADVYKEVKTTDENNHIVEENIKNKDVEEVYLTLKKKFDVKPKYLAILEDLFEGKDTIITDANYEEISPFVFSYLEKSIIKGKKILVLAETDLYTNAQNRELIKDWFEGCFKKLYKKSIRKIVTFDDWRNHTSWDILIGTQSEIIKHQQDFIQKIQEEQNELKDLVVFVINEKLDEIAENVLTLSILSNILNTHFKVNKNEDEGAQYIILSNGTANLKVSINKNLGINAEEHHISNTAPKNFYGIIWRADSRKEYYTEIMDGVPKVELGISSTLSYLAWNHGFKNLNFVEQSNLPYLNYENNVEMAKDYLKDRPISKTNLNDIYRNIAINNPITSLTKKSNKNILFVEDKLCNAPVLLKKFSSLGIEETFVNVISENYLLRDYFVDNIDYFTSSPHYGYTPKIESNNYKVAAYLKELLTNAHIKVSEEDIKIEMMSIESSIKNIEEELVKLFLNVYGINILKRDYLSVETQRVYSVEKNDFEEKKFYKLSADISENTYFKWFENFEIIDSGRKIYGVIPFEHVYQNYLKNQVHCFDGRSYSVESIDLINKKINIVPSKREKRVTYRNKDEIKIEKINSKLKNKFGTFENGNYILEKKTHSATYEIDTVGYYEFLNGKNQDYRYNPLESLGEKFTRDYSNGQILSISLKTKELKIRNSDAVATTLVVLLNEIFRTVFPENYRYIKIFTSVPENFFKTETSLEYYEEGFSTPDYLAHILPSKVSISKTEYKNIFEENNENVINLYFVEDSHKDIGLVRAISDNFEEILELIQDYLNWLDGGNIPKKLWNKSEIKNSEKLEYLRYGLEKLSEEIDIEELTHLLNKILGENKFTEARKRYYEKISIDSKKEDDFDKEYAYLKSKI